MIALTPTKQHGCNGWNIEVTGGPKGRTVKANSLGGISTALKSAVSTAFIQGLIQAEEYRQITGEFKFFFGEVEITLNPGKNRWEESGIKATITSQKSVFEVFTEGANHWVALRSALSESVYKGHLSLEEYQTFTGDPLLGTPEHIADVLRSKMAVAKNGRTYMIKSGPFAFSGIGRVKE
jgi:hypothetical protein